jgi:hypothetical protein
MEKPDEARSVSKRKRFMVMHSKRKRGRSLF